MIWILSDHCDGTLVASGFPKEGSETTHGEYCGGEELQYFGTTRDRIVQETVPGGHIGLFMGARTLLDHWPQIARWITAQ
jgi:hypothetical protein